MDDSPGYRLPRVLLPRPGTNLHKWAVIACDQHTAEPAYWDEVAREVGDAPSTLHLIYPEVHLGAADAPARIARIQQTMQRYLAEGLFVEHAGAVYVERTLGSGTRRGVMLELDLEHYDFNVGSTSLIRPTEGTIVERLAPRIAVRRGAALEVPHILVLIDDPQRSVIEPIGAQRDALTRLYETDLMLGGGHVAGYAVDAARAARLTQALAALADPASFAARYGVPAATPPLLFAVGDGNHSLATAKAIWADAKSRVGPDHPSRWALVEVVNIHDAALDFAPIHRLLFGVTIDVRQALAQAFASRVSCTELPTGDAMRQWVAAAARDGHRRQTIGLIGPGPRFSVVEIADPAWALAVSSLQPIIDAWIIGGGVREIDYVHGDQALERLAQREGCVGIHVAAIGKDELMNRVVRDGPTPRKTFSMGEAHEKRYYVEARRIATGNA